jgi:probable phosphomutase (TIGR03848 family)
MPILLLIRHGENDYVKTRRLAGRSPGIHLNEKGQKQAAELAGALRNVPLAATYASPLERCIETAEPIARARGLEVQITNALLETNIGEWQGAELRKVSKLPEWKLVQGAPSRFRFPGGDSFVEQQTRLVAEVERIIRLHQPHDIVALVFHADPIKMVLAYYLGMPLDFFQRLACDTGSVSVLMLSDSGAMLYRMNMRPPFSLPEPPKKRRRAQI